MTTPATPPDPPESFGGGSPYLNTGAQPPVGTPVGGPPPPPQSGSKKGCFIIGGIAGAVLLLICGCGGYFAMQGVKEAKMWEPHMAGFGAGADFEALPEDAEPYLKTPVIAVVMQDNDETESMTNDPPYRGDLNRKDGIESLKAKTPEEVRTVIITKWDQIEDGYYGDDETIKGYIQSCEVIVVDWEDRKVVTSAVFIGGPSPEEISEDKDAGYGPKPWDEIEEFLLALPQK